MIYNILAGELKKVLKSKLFLISMIIYILIFVIALVNRFFNKTSGVYLYKIELEKLNSFSLIFFYIMHVLFLGAVLGGYVGGYEFHSNTFCFSHIFEGRIKQHVLKIFTLFILLVGILLITFIITNVFCFFRISDIEFRFNFKRLIRQSLVILLISFELSLFSYILAIVIRKIYVAISVAVLLPFLINILCNISNVFKYLNKYWFTTINSMLISQVFSNIASSENYVTIKLVDKSILNSFNLLLLVSISYLIVFLVIILLIGFFVSDN
ncbi:hypothetical protein [Caldicellulosiruptor naganoensis]|uniref:ABC-2 family transporter protein n=1 Tax=Caldicellulosiruptor naganoensis TaxID=29324 RepID=A0ABY7BF56_9FIRM|nr:hypothetical protein [Caldicellulosiruptor naganoensis]WAM30997.1 hypothetical protein OTJ99_001799 [Caldicellulosiruptor naganoensis]